MSLLCFSRTPHPCKSVFEARSRGMRPYTMSIQRPRFPCHQHSHWLCDLGFRARNAMSSPSARAPRHSISSHRQCRFNSIAWRPSSPLRRTPLSTQLPTRPEPIIPTDHTRARTQVNTPPHTTRTTPPPTHSYLTRIGDVDQSTRSGEEDEDIRQGHDAHQTA